LVGSDGSDLRQLTGSGYNFSPRWSPDGKRIAFVRYFQGGPKNSQGFPMPAVYVMNPDGSNEVRRTIEGDFWSVAWSPDGKRFAVSDEGTYYADISLLQVEGDAPPVRIATDARSPAWSPDGSKIAFVRTSGDDGYHSLWVMDADGTNQQPITPVDPGAIFFPPSWSKDGHHLLFAKCLDTCEAYTVNVDGQELHLVPTGGSVDGAFWSPDEKWIALSLATVTGNQWQLATAYVPAQGGIPRQIIKGGYSPSWRP
jgi:Tol biopolymer transport system component